MEGNSPDLEPPQEDKDKGPVAEEVGLGGGGILEATALPNSFSSCSSGFPTWMSCILVSGGFQLLCLE